MLSVLAEYTKPFPFTLTSLSHPHIPFTPPHPFHTHTSLSPPLFSQDFFLKYLGATVAVALIIGPFFGGHLRPDDSLQGRAAMLSNMRYHTSVVISLFSALGTLGAASRKALKLGGYADRVVELRAKMQSLTGAHGGGREIVWGRL